MTCVTDEMVEAALDIWTDKSWRTSGGAITALVYGQRMRAALEAALAVAPKDEDSERKSAFDAAEASAWQELEWAGERGSRLIVYDGVNVLVPVRDIRQAIAELSNGDRQHTVMLARGNIEKTLPAVRQGTASQYAAMMCARDVAIWFANEIIEGRETLKMNEP